MVPWDLHVDKKTDSSGESVLPLPHAGSGDRTQVCRLGSKGPKLLSHITQLQDMILTSFDFYLIARTFLYLFK